MTKKLLSPLSFFFPRLVVALAKTGIFAFCSFLFPHSALAQINNPVVNNSAQQVSDPTGYTSNVIQTVISIFFVVGVIYFTWHLFFAGYHYIASDGDPKKIEGAKNEIMFGVLGLGVMFAVFAILKLVGYVLGIQGLDSLNLLIPTL